jgi:hypothetical protein
MMNKLNPFRKPTAKEIAARDLEEARRQLLKEQSAAEYHSRMAEYYKGVEKRLGAFLKEES